MTKTSPVSRRSGKSNLTIGAMLVSAMAIGLWAISAAPTRADEPYPWCAEYNGDDGSDGVNCGFDTLAQCRATISGIGGNCYENPAYPGPTPRPKKKTKTPKSH